MTAHHALGPGAVHLCIDMQVLFTPPGRWATPGLEAIVPPITAITRAHPTRTLFTRFVVPDTADAAKGCWQRYYRHWWDFTGAQLPEGRIDLLDDLKPLARPGMVIDKPTHSAFETPALEAALQAMAATTLVLTGIETDVCVLATALAGIDRGYHIVAVVDAMTSSSPAGHRATLDHVLPRFDQQVDIMDAAALLAAWRA